MIKRYPGLSVVGISLLAAVGIFIALMPSSPDLPTQGIVQSAGARYQPGGSKCSGDSLSSGQLADCAEEDERYRVQFDGLIQQARAANAAEAQAKMAYNVAWMVLVGTVAGICTLVAVILAAFYARNAAEAARGSLNHATRTSNIELRPWLQLEIETDKFWLTQDQVWVRFFLTLRNVGKLPATGVLMHSQVFSHDPHSNEVSRYFCSQPKSTDSRTILPQGEIKQRMIAQGQRDRIVNAEADGQVDPMLTVKVFYEWDGGGKGRTCHSFEMHQYRETGDEAFQPIRIDPQGDPSQRFAVSQTRIDNII
jgi:hypothetical protein